MRFIKQSVLRLSDLPAAGVFAPFVPFDTGLLIGKTPYLNNGNPFELTTAILLNEFVTPVIDNGKVFGDFETDYFAWLVFSDKVISDAGMTYLMAKDAAPSTQFFWSFKNNKDPMLTGLICLHAGETKSSIGQLIGSSSMEWFYSRDVLSSGFEVERFDEYEQAVLNGNIVSDDQHSHCESRTDIYRDMDLLILGKRALSNGIDILSKIEQGMFENNLCDLELTKLGQ